MTDAAPALDLLLALTQRWPRVAVDTTELPVCVSLLGRPGGEHFFGGSIASALTRALEATTPRAAPAEKELP